jgi:membrane protein implicated in regulation of membrane protease activity
MKIYASALITGLLAAMTGLAAIHYTSLGLSAVAILAFLLALVLAVGRGSREQDRPTPRRRHDIGP